MVGAGRFERPTPCAQGRCATRLRYAPTVFILHHFWSMGSVRKLSFDTAAPAFVVDFRRTVSKPLLTESITYKLRFILDSESRSAARRGINHGSNMNRNL